MHPCTDTITTHPSTPNRILLLIDICYGITHICIRIIHPHIFDTRIIHLRIIDIRVHFIIFITGLGTMNAIGYFKENSRDVLSLNITTSDQTQLNNWSKLRLKYPEVMSTCVTNDWVVQSIRAQKKFSRLYEFIGTNTLILCADNNKEVNIRYRDVAYVASSCLSVTWTFYCSVLLCSIGFVIVCVSVSVYLSACMLGCLSVSYLSIAPTWNPLHLNDESELLRIALNVTARISQVSFMLSLLLINDANRCYLSRCLRSTSTFYDEASPFLHLSLHHSFLAIQSCPTNPVYSPRAICDVISCHHQYLSPQS